MRTENRCTFSESMSCAVDMAARARVRWTGLMSLFAMLTAIGACPGCKTGTTGMAAFLRIIDCDDRVRIRHGLIADVQYLECSDVDQSRQIKVYSGPGGRLPVAGVGGIAGRALAAFPPGR